MLRSLQVGGQLGEVIRISGLFHLRIVGFLCLLPHDDKVAIAAPSIRSVFSARRRVAPCWHSLWYLSLCCTEANVRFSEVNQQVSLCLTGLNWASRDPCVQRGLEICSERWEGENVRGAGVWVIDSALHGTWALPCVFSYTGRKSRGGESESRTMKEGASSAVQGRVTH